MKNMKQLMTIYMFVENPAPDRLGRELHENARRLALRGTLIVAPEGFNIALWGEESALESFLDGLCRRFPLENAQIRRDSVAEAPFDRLRLKVKREVIKLGRTVDTTRNAGRYIDAEELERMRQESDVILLDTRNDYETLVGTFRDALTLPIRHFSQFPQHAAELRERLRGKRVITFCTGGVRCEKAVPLLLEQGVDAYELRGGILAYFDRYPAGAWDGECFVFDNRYTIRPDGGPGSYRPCQACGQPLRGELRDATDAVCPSCGKHQKTKTPTGGPGSRLLP